MDLTKQPPRSPHDALGGITFLPRSIDKMRAHLAGTAGEYRAKTGFSTQLFTLLGVTADEFEEIVRQNPTDDGVLAALTARRKVPQEEISAWNERAMSPPSDDAGRAQHRKMLEDAGYGHRTDITNRYDRLDLDDGREVPIGGRSASAGQ
jgi:hypothetical protein